MSVFTVIYIYTAWGFVLKYISDSDRSIREACYSNLAATRFHD